MQAVIVPKRALSDDEIESCFTVMQELRPHLNRKTFLETIRDLESEGFQLAYIADNHEVVTVAGFRISTNLFMGKHLYVDDLVTSGRSRSEGYGEAMIHWLREKALEEQCNYIHLDSGTHRDQAHKFYFKHGFNIASYHFSQKLNDF